MGAIKKMKEEHLLADVKSAIVVDQPKLIAEMRDDGVIVKGIYILKTEPTATSPLAVLDEYSVEIFFPFAFPDVQPRVRETDRKIEPNIDNHITSEDGNCCIFVWEAWAAGKKDITAQMYFDIPLYNFFFSQYHFRTTGKWPFGDEKHGIQGVIDAYAEKLGCRPDFAEVRGFLTCCTKQTIKPQWACPCGSQRALRDCCANKVHNMKRSITKRDANKMLCNLAYLSDGLLRYFESLEQEAGDEI